MAGANSHIMNFRHAIGFLCVGLVLNRLPQLAPHWFATTGIDGGSSRLLWLSVMSWVQVAIGSSYLAGRISGTLASLLAYTPPAPADVVRAAVAPQYVPLRTTRVRPAPAHPVLPLPATFDGGLLEQQRAA